jgi:hypothetical protein
MSVARVYVFQARAGERASHVRSVYCARGELCTFNSLNRRNRRFDGILHKKSTATRKCCGRRQKSFVESSPEKERANRYRTKICADSDSAHNGSKTRSTSEIPLPEWSSLERHFPGWTPFSTAGSQLTVRPRRLGRILPNNYICPLLQLGKRKFEIRSIWKFGQRQLLAFSLFSVGHFENFQILLVIFNRLENWANFLLFVFFFWAAPRIYIVCPSVAAVRYIINDINRAKKTEVIYGLRREKLGFKLSGAFIEMAD